LQDTAAMLARSAPPKGDGVCIYAISGGTGAHMADLASAAGLRLPEVSAETQTALHEWIPTYLRVSNPVDNGGAPSADWRGRTFANCIGAVKAYFDYHAFAARYRSPFARKAAKSKPVEIGSGEHASKQLLAHYGIPITREEVVTSAAAAVKAANAIGFPVVLKAEGVDHKSDEGLVRLGLSSAKEVRDAFAELSSKTGRVLVAEQISGGTECVIGVSRDELFGPVIMFGLGGV